MKKIVSIVLSCVISSSLFAGVGAETQAYIESESVVKAYKELINSDPGIRNAKSIGSAKGLADWLNIKIGTLNSNIQNLQLPTSTVAVANDWQSLFFKIDQYINAAGSKEEYYFRLHQYASAILPDAEILWGAMVTSTLNEGANASNAVASMFRFVLGSNKKSVSQNCIINSIIFVQLIDKTSNDTFAKQHFKDNGLQAKWNKLKGELEL